MTALMIVFMATMAVGNDGQERVLTEMDPLLGLEGLWKETCHSVGLGNDPAGRAIIFNKTSRWGLRGCTENSFMTQP
jgi:hypothetical protein